MRYNLDEVTGPQVVFTDYCNDFAAWINLGWTTSTTEAHSGQTSFFSGSADNLANFIESAQPLSLPEGGLLSFYAWYSTQEDWDSLAGFTRDICYVEWSPDRGSWHELDSLYGDKEAWQERRYLLPAGAKYLRFRYVSNAGINRLGVFLDDIRVYAFGGYREVVEGTDDTTAAVFGVPHDTAGYYYLVSATDSFGNVSMASELCKVEVATWAEPYTRPAPFAGKCELILDFPSGETTDVLIYTLSGTLVRRFDSVSQHVLDWDGDNAAGKPLADGLYLVAVQSRDFQKLRENRQSRPEMRGFRNLGFKGFGIRGYLEPWALSYSVSGRILPGFRMPSGSSACFRLRISASSSGPVARFISHFLVEPMPCSAEI